PNNGDCNGAMSDNNLKLDSIVSPLTGRMFTSGALTAATPVVVRVRNLDNATVASFAIKYRINEGDYTEAIINTPLPALGTYTHSFPPIDLSVAGSYTVTAIVQNLSANDPHTADDTLQTVVRQLPNVPVDLSTPLNEGFEDATNATIQRPVRGLAGTTRWDYVNQDPLARLRTFVTPDVARSGSRAITLDVSKSIPRVVDPFNQLIGTFNLQNYNTTASEVRLAFHYKHHGITQLPHAGNKLWVRGKDTDPWIELFDLGANQPVNAGEWKEIPALEVNDILKQNGQEFSSSTQVRFGQYALYSMADNENFAGLSFDDISLFLAANDVQLLEITAPSPFECANGLNALVTIKVRNGMPVALSNIPARFRMDGGTWVEETIPSIPAKSVAEFTFQTSASWLTFGKILLEAEVRMPGDNIPGNDQTSLTILRQPVISTFPYYQDFENGPSGFIADGIRSTWEFGTPASLRINTAASGVNAWKTRLRGDYQDLERSYLYTPCFDISGLSQPMLSFSLAYSFEDCRRFNVVCDAGWMEYTTDGGRTWQKLGAYGQGESWYDHEAGQTWMLADQTDWREAIIPLPKHDGIIRLRYVLSSDQGSTREGLAIDNFHIYNGGPLPLQWLSFTATLMPDQRVGLQWRVANLRQGESFAVQVSRYEGSASGFQTIATIEAGSGNNGLFEYIDDPVQKKGRLFYRIIWNRSDGQQIISPVRAISFNIAGGSIQVFPNPAQQFLYVTATTANDSPATLKILSIDGRVLFTTRAIPVGGYLSARIELSSLSLARGVYFLEMTSEMERQVVKWIRN
ncbi:MAG TPA: T9SS type A sorting domain-containing protein, partial [Phnomibacter sp.]|nr:T9SS type A sorting domain-containing protein [Phnomibacter sp.]